MMRTQKIVFPTHQVLCVFPEEHTELGQALSELHLNESYPVIVLIGGEIDAAQADVTRQAIQTVSRIANDMNALVICGGTDMGIMAEIGQVHSKSAYTFPLVGIAPEALVTWKDGPASTKKLWWGKERWQLAPHYTHFILVPGSDFGDEFSLDHSHSSPFIQKPPVCDGFDQWRRGVPKGYRSKFERGTPGHRLELHRTSG